MIFMFIMAENDIYQVEVSKDRSPSPLSPLLLVPAWPCFSSIVTDSRITWCLGNASGTSSFRVPEPKELVTCFASGHKHAIYDVK